ncbi:hypothetical protein E2C01_038349 [Portunus trituberculatus]|uniref:Uncharacterized protein n=1 Tax=Portunus trituberculatus TaxID=210409 RepID=A0A5B7FC00_PORTR|nr:hypothetical protein [Portunus trituberculatus]
MPRKQSNHTTLCQWLCTTNSATSKGMNMATLTAEGICIYLTENSFVQSVPLLLYVYGHRAALDKWGPQLERHGEQT